MLVFKFIYMDLTSEMTSIQKLILSTNVLLLITPLSVVAATNGTKNSVPPIFSWSATGAISTNYIGRGVSLSDDRPTAEASFRLSTRWGGYGDIWASGLNLTDTQGDAVTTELDFKAGYKKTYYDVTYDLGFVSYVFPSTVGLDFNEVFLELHYQYFNVGVNYSNNAAGAGDRGLYSHIGVDYPLGLKPYYLQDISLHGYLAYYDFSGPTLGPYDYLYYKVSVSKPVNEYIDFSLSLSDTDNGFAGIVGAKRVKTKVFATLSFKV